MSLRIGDTAPNFKAQTQLGEIDLYEWAGDQWVVLFSHPKDFTPVCTTELGAVARYQKDFEQRNVKPIAVSVDGVAEHIEWIKDINEVGSVTVQYPIIADQDRSVSELYGMLDQTNKEASGMPLTVRSVFIIDPKKKIRLMITYPASTGRNFKEVLRVIDSLQLTDQKSLATPVDWVPGDKAVIVPSIPDEKAKEIFGEFETVRPYLRYTTNY